MPIRGNNNMRNPIKREKVENEIRGFEYKVVARWTKDVDKHKIDILVGNYLDNYEFNRYNELKIMLACLKG